MGLATSASLRIGAISISIAVMNADKPADRDVLGVYHPTALPQGDADHHRQGCGGQQLGEGVMAAEAMVDLIVRLPQALAQRAKRLAWLCWRRAGAPCGGPVRFLHHVGEFIGGLLADLVSCTDGVTRSS